MKKINLAKSKMKSYQHGIGMYIEIHLLQKLIHAPLKVVCVRACVCMRNRARARVCMGREQQGPAHVINKSLHPQ